MCATRSELAKLLPRDPAFYDIDWVRVYHISLRLRKWMDRCKYGIDDIDRATMQLKYQVNFYENARHFFAFNFTEDESLQLLMTKDNISLGWMPTGVAQG